jgi:hypothetical protein
MPCSGSAPGTAEAIVPDSVRKLRAETVYAAVRESFACGNAAGKKPGRCAEG